MAQETKCPACSHINPPHNRFCAACGKRMGKRPSGRDTQAPILEGEPSGVSIVLLNPDGTDNRTVPVPTGLTTLGRQTGGVFAADNYLSARHVTLTPERKGLQVEDHESLNGIYRRLLPKKRYPLNPGQIFRMGQEIIKFEELEKKPISKDGVEYMGAPLEGYVGRIAMVLGRETRGTAFPVPDSGLSLGRERGEVLFADDGYVSGLHCRLTYATGQVFLTDLGSSNGTFIQVLGREFFGDGDILLLGQQLFRVQG